MIEYNLSLASKYSFLKSSDYLAAVRLHCEMLPEYMPMKWGWTEPRKLFDPSNIEQLVHPNGNTETVFWRRTGKDRAFGYWMLGSSKWNHHGRICLDTHKATHQQKLLAYLKAASILNEADIAALDSNVDKGKELAKFVYYLPSGSTATTGISAGIDLSTHTLRHWLSDMPWAVVFGSAYVRLFGKERLLSCPAYKVEDMGEEMVFIQLTPNMSDIHEQYDEVIQARAAAKQHLGEECFFKPELAYDFRGSAGGGPSKEEIAAKQGKVFRVPVFELNAD